MEIDSHREFISHISFYGLFKLSLALLSNLNEIVPFVTNLIIVTQSIKGCGTNVLAGIIPFSR